MIKIAHLYYDLMNLYGDNGNIKILKKVLENQGIKTSIEFLSVDDKFDFNDFDIIYIGPGTYNNEKIVLRELLKRKHEIKTAFNNNNTFFLITGNALELFGNFIKENHKKYEALGLIDFDCEKINDRLVSEVYAKSNEISDYVIGFKNQDGIIKTKAQGLFKIIKGYGFNKDNNNEGIFMDNFFGTYLIGPVLVRNPELLIYFTKKIINKKFKDFKFKDFDLDYEIKAHNEYLKNYFLNTK